ASQEITLGVRPNHIILNDGTNAVEATVDVSEMMGSEVHLHVNANGKDVVIIVPTMDISGEQNELFGYGRKINFTFGGNVCHVFDKDGNNLEA
ncbi:MAG: TOBE domain-containing protein, partial [Oscillospiraceae bacterium]|nr:TOBE domain-containing protein [Oscillospiraceae bacterium]